jgi:hypothetical protein
MSTFFKVVGGIAVVIVALAVLIGVGYAFRWIDAGLETVDPSNIRRLSAEANDRWNALETKRDSIINQEKGLADFYTLYGDDTSKWPQGKTEEYQQLVQALRNLKTSYNNDCGDYMAMWDDEWRDLPAPDDLPTTCQTFQ